MPQQLKRVSGRHPPVRLFVVPVTVGRLTREQLGAPPLLGHARPLGRNSLAGLMGEVAHDLPADRRIPIEQPIHNRRLARHASLPLIRPGPHSVTAIRLFLDARISSQHSVSTSASVAPERVPLVTAQRVCPL